MVGSRGRASRSAAASPRAASPAGAAASTPISIRLGDCGWLKAGDPTTMLAGDATVPEARHPEKHGWLKAGDPTTMLERCQKA
jgi:hypothetical protein